MLRASKVLMNIAHSQTLSQKTFLLRCRLGWSGLVLAAALHSSAADTNTAESRLALAPPTDWVTPQFFERLPQAAKPEGSEDQRWLLLERQINAAENETFVHYVRQIQTVSGVQNGANLSIDFNPSYQSLTMHWVRIWRGTNILNRLERENIKLVQQERDLEQYQFNGEQSAVLVLADVRVGDLVDCAYSLRGANPVLAGKFSGSVSVQLAQPVEHLSTRLLWPRARHLYAKNHGCSPTPAVLPKKELIEYRWDFRKVPGMPMEDSLPVWYDPEPWVQLSEFQNWAEVNQWALELFQNSAPLSPELTQKISEWRQISSREAQVSAVLRFLQDEVRYFGIEIGKNSHQPSSPALVFSRRFGDCKDKALLFVTILRALGIEAYPVLVDTETRQAIQGWQPSAVAFDHVIAQVWLDRQCCWLDPTDCYQRGSLAEHYLPNYGAGLVIHPQTTGLSKIPPTASNSKTTISEYFQLRGKMDNADLKVVTVAEGGDADDWRAQVATTAREKIEKYDLKFYSQTYSGIKKARPMVVVDDEPKNRIEITEYYTLDKMWVWSEKDQSYQCQFYASGIDALLKKPADAVRTMPFAVASPRHQILRTEVILPEAWPGDSQNKTIYDPAFSFRMNLRNRGNKIEMEYEYNSLADSVPANRAADYIQHVNDSTKSLGYTLTWR